MKPLRPMLAGTVSLEQGVTFPVMASFKLDGIRALVVNGSLASRTLKPIANEYTRRKFSLASLEGYDGELIVGPPNDPKCFNTTTSAIARYDGAPNATFYVFDNFRVSGGFSLRFGSLQWGRQHANIHVLEHRIIADAQQLESYEMEALTLGYEGLILRSLNGPYKFGRSTLKEGYMLKLKRFTDSEAIVLWTEEEMENLNAKEIDERGYTKRSSFQENLVGKGRMGALMVRDLHSGVEFAIGTGFTAADREQEWRKGDVVKYKSFPVGVKDKPRHPVFIGRRARFDTPEPNPGE